MTKPNPNRPPQRAKSLRHFAEGVKRTSRTIARWPDHPDVLSMRALQEKLDHARGYLDEVAEALEKLPADYPPKPLPAASMIKPGAVVCVRAAYRRKYENLVPNADLDRCTVVSVNDKHLTFKTNTGVVSLAAKKHVKVIE